MPSIVASQILAHRIAPARLSHLDRLAIESAIHDAYASGFNAGADWQRSERATAQFPAGSL